MRSLIATAAICVVTVPLFAQTLVCGRASAPPKLDAVPDDACWRNAMVATDFSVLGSGGKRRAFRQSTVRAAWDGQALYLHAILLEPDPASITAKVTRRDDPVWMEDALEIFLRPDATAPDYFHFIINARGVLYDEHNTDPSYDSGARAVAKIVDQAWRIELSIPWTDLPGRPDVGAEWGFNVGREHRPKDPREWSTWAPLEKGAAKFARPKLFGRLRFAEKAEPGRASRLVQPPAIGRNPAFADLTDGKPTHWKLYPNSTFGEVSPASRHYSVHNEGDYSIASQPIDVPVEAGDVFTVYAVIRGGGGAAGGIAVVQEMEDGRPDDLYPFWKREVTEKFRLYAGRITVDKGAKRLFSIRLYRANKRGWIDYAYCQVLPGAHGLAGIFDADHCTTSEQRGLGQPWRTPALASFTPLPGGPLKALVFIGEFQRDAVELAQRLELDHDLAYCPTYRHSNKVEQAVAFDAEEILGRLDRHEYDLIILAGRPSDPAVIDDILDTVHAGAGLLAVEPLLGGKAVHPEELQRVLDILPVDRLSGDERQPIMGALDPDVLKQTSRGKEVLKGIATREHGAGRVVRLTWGTGVSGLVPFTPGHCQYWEYRWALLAKCALWAGRRESPAVIESLQCIRDLMVRVRSKQSRPLTVAVSWDTALGLDGASGGAATAAVTATVKPTKDGVATLSIPVESRLRRMRGPHVARVALLSSAGPVDLAACTVPGAEPRITINRVHATQMAQPGETVAVRTTYLAQVDGILRTELVDAFGRIIARDETGVSAGNGEANAALRASNPRSVCHRIVVSALDGELIADQRERQLFIPATNRDHLDRFRLGVGYAAMHVRCPEYLYDHLVAFLRSQGVEAATVNEYMIQRGMPAFGGQICGGGMRYQGGSNVREHSFSNPAEVEALAKRTVKGVGKKRHWGFFGFNMADEVHLHQGESVEVDASEHALRAFRSWAKREYGTVGDVNAEWGTSYASFGDIEVPLLSDMRNAENPARWVDFRLFMEREWANAYAAAHRALRETYPDVNLSFTNPYKYGSLSGTNFALWTPHEEIQLRYCHRHVLDRIRSWSDAPVLSWFGYRSDAATCGHFVWNLAFNGGAVALWWDPVEPWAYSGKDGFTAWYLLGPLWRETGRSRTVTRAAKALQGGIGTLLRIARPEAPEALVVHSQSSMHVLYAQAAMPKGRPVNDGYRRYAASDEALAQCLIRNGLHYRYVLPEQLTPARLEGVRLVVLPSCVALSDEAGRALTAFAANGGRLLADLPPGAHDEHGRPRADASFLSAPFEGGRGVCLGQGADQDRKDALDKAVAQMGVHGAVRWQAANGRPPQRTRMYRFRLGEGRYLGILPAAAPEAAADGPLTVDLPEERNVYDCRAGARLGRFRRLSLALRPGEPHVLALLPYEPTGIRATASFADESLIVRASLSSDAEPSDHIFHIAVTRAGEAEPFQCYTRSVTASRGRAEISIPLALNDPGGEWTVQVRDVATGLATTAKAVLARK